MMTALRRGEEPPADAAALAELATLGYARTEPAGLTSAGRQLREEIEADTDARSQRSYDTLHAEDANDFLAALRRLPGKV